MKAPYKTVKTTLKSILVNHEVIQPQINNLVIKLNELVVQTYQFIRLYILNKYNNDSPLPNIDEKFIFGNDCILAYGDWSRTSQMKHFIPTKNIGIRRLIHKKFLTISVNEYNTTKKCCYCHNDLSYVNKSKTIRHLKCSEFRKQRNHI